MAVRPARCGDLAAVLGIAREGFPAAPDRIGAAWLVARLGEGGTRLLVEDAGGGLVRGFVLLVGYELATCVRLVAVAEAYRRQGVGKALAGAVPAPACAWVREENAASRGLFAAAGWAVVANAKSRRRGEWVYFTKAG